MEATRKESMDSDNNCLLCYQDIKYYSIGKCGHKNVCHTCCLRLRLIMEDETCPMCKTELEEVLITHDKNIEWKHFDKKMKKSCEEDPEDECIYYHTDECRIAGMHFRNLTCMMHNCKSN